MRIRFGRNTVAAVLTCAVLFALAPLLAADDPPQFSPWSAAVKVGPLGPPISSTVWREVDPFIAKNDLDLYFGSNNPDLPGWQGRVDIYVSHRDTVDDPWEDPINLGPKINSQYYESGSFVTIDGHWLYFVSDRPGGCGGLDIWVSHRKDKRDDDGWETPINLGCGTINSAVQDLGPYLFEDEATGQTFLYFTSYNRPGGKGLNDIWVSTMVGEDHEAFGPPSPVVELNTASGDHMAFVRRKDGLEVIFISNRSGGTGDQDLWSSTRPDTLSPWSAPVNLGPLVNSSSIEGRPSLSWDGTTLYFGTNRNWPQGDYADVYMATRTKLKGKGADKNED